MAVLKALNLGLAFLLELLMLVAFGYWGFNTGDSALVHWLLGLGVPLVAIVIWGIFNAPNSARRLPRLPRTILELAMFGLAALALVIAGQPTWAVIFIVLVIVNQILLYVWQQ
ncbi:MAG: DUF2568 domain-containing protein [Anaerolineaceae bacterium]|nr:DUF2568 domain-containing protein [Anaerolineaceae bacterium]